MNPTERRELKNEANPLGVKLGGSYALLVLAIGLGTSLFNGDQKAIYSSAIQGAVGFGLILLSARAAYVAGWRARDQANSTKPIDQPSSK